MHICLVSNEYPPMPHGGIGSVCQDLAEMLVQAGHRVTVAGIYPRQALGPKLTRGMQVEVRRGVRIVRLVQSPAQMRYHIGTLSDRLRLKRLLHQCHQSDPFDLIETADYAGLLCFGGLKKVPSIVRIHGSNIFFDTLLNRPGVPFEHNLERATLHRATHICAVSHFAAKATLKICGMPDRECKVIPNAVDETLFSPLPDTAPIPGRILFVNSINPKKGVEELICSLPFIVNRVPNAHLVIVGRDSLRFSSGQSYSNSLLEKLRPSLRERVTFTGALDRRVGVLNALREAEVCCYPSHMETFGIAAVEAMSLAKPTVFSKAGPGPEVIDDGVNGLLCDPCDPVDIADKICAFLQNPAYALETGRRAREKVVAEFSHDRWLKRNLEYYAECMAQMHAGSTHASTLKILTPPRAEAARSPSSATAPGPALAKPHPKPDRPKLHVGLVCNEFPPVAHGGIGSTTHDLATGLAALGHKITVFGIYSQDNLRVLENTQYPPGIQLSLFPEHRGHRGARPRQFLDRLNLRRHINAVHARDPLDLVEYLDYGGWLAYGGISRLPQIVRLQGSNALFDKELNRTGDQLEHWLEIKSLRQANYLIGVSRYALDESTLLAAPSLKPSRVIYNCVDTDLFCPDPSVPVEKGLIVFVNSISPRKGVIELFQALDEIFTRVPHSRLALIGEITYRGQAAVDFKARLMASVSGQFHNRILWLGRKDRGSGVLEYLRRAEICCYPSHAETFGIAPAEAMAVEKPVVYTRLGPGPEVIEHGVSGLLADPRDPVDIAAQVVRLLENPEFARSLGVAGRERVVSHFSKRDWVQRNLEFYYQCIHKDQPERFQYSEPPMAAMF